MSIEQQKSLLNRINPFLFFGVLFFGSLYLAKSFLVPISIALLLALLMLPVSQKLEKTGMSRTWSSLFSVLLVLSFFIAIFVLLSLQVSNIADDWPQTKEQVTQKAQQLQSYLQSQGISIGNLKNRLEQFSKSSGNSVTTAFSATFSSLGDFLLILVYIFLFLFYRHRFRIFFQKLNAGHSSNETDKVLYEASQISQGYLAGKVILILILSVLYGLGFVIIGIKYAILIAVLAAVFSIIPYVGNIIGGVLALILAVVTKGSTSAILGVLIVMSIAQFLETYILEPLIVGKRVELNPFFTILIVVLGGAVWGIPGMIVAIPYLGIVKVILDHVKPLAPYAYLIGEDESSGDDDFMSKVKRWFKKQA